MVKVWDDTFKKLIHADPQAFVSWFVPEAQFIKERLNELESVQLEADGLLQVKDKHEDMIIHIECQTYQDPDMAERLLQYHVNIRRQFKLPVLSCVIYLLQDGNVPISPLIWKTPAEEEMLRFHFRSIQIGQLTEEDILATQQPGLYPFLPLTQGENKRDKVERMFQELGGTGQTALELIGFTFASLVFRNRSSADQNWLIRRFGNMHDILRETPIYQEILKEGREEGLEQGLHKGIVIGRKEGIQEGIEQGLEQGKLKGLNEAVLKIVTQRFPKLVRLAKKQIFLIEDTDILLDLIGRLTVAQSAKEAKEHLLALDEDEEEGY